MPLHFSYCGDIVSNQYSVPLTKYFNYFIISFSTEEGVGHDPSIINHARDKLYSEKLLSLTMKDSYIGVILHCEKCACHQEWTFLWENCRHLCIQEWEMLGIHRQWRGMCVAKKMPPARRITFNNKERPMCWIGAFVLFGICVAHDSSPHHSKWFTIKMLVKA